MTRTILLSGADLISKYGFQDGDLIEVPGDPTSGHISSDVLIELVRAHLIPEVEKRFQPVELIETGGAHNPIRISDSETSLPDFSEIYVTVDAATVDAAIARHMPVSGSALETIQEITECDQLNDNWNGEGSLAPSMRTIRHTRTAAAVIPDGLNPEVTPDTNGCITIDLERDGRRAHLMIGITRYAGFVSGAGDTTFHEGAATDAQDCLSGMVDALLS